MNKSVDINAYACYIETKLLENKNKNKSYLKARTFLRCANLAVNYGSIKIVGS